MNLSSKRFRVKSLTQRTDTGFFGDQPVQTKYTRVMLEEDTQQRDGDSITIISHDGSMDGFDLKLGDTYEMALIPRTDAQYVDRASGHGASTHPAHPAPQSSSVSGPIDYPVPPPPPLPEDANVAREGVYWNPKEDVLKGDPHTAEEVVESHESGMNQGRDYFPAV